MHVKQRGIAGLFLVLLLALALPVGIYALNTSLHLTSKAGAPIAPRPCSAPNVDCPPFGNSAVSLSFNPSVDIIEVGKEFTVDVELNATSGDIVYTANAVQANIRYAKNYLDYIDATVATGSGHPNFEIIAQKKNDANNGLLSIAVGTKQPVTSASVVRLKFKAKAPTFSSQTLTNASLPFSSLKTKEKPPRGVGAFLSFEDSSQVIDDRSNRNILQKTDYASFAIYNVQAKRALACGMFGDVNQDGQISNADLAPIGRHILGRAQLSDLQRYLADVVDTNTDGPPIIDEKDFIAIAEYLNNYTQSMPICAKTKVSPCGNIGDVDNDKLVTKLDAYHILQIVTRLETTHDDPKRADVDGNGSITARDALMVNRYLLDLITTFPGCPVPSKPGDIDANGKVDIFDLSKLINQWGVTGQNIADLNGDKVVDVKDLSILLANWTRETPSPRPSASASPVATSSASPIATGSATPTASASSSPRPNWTGYLPNGTCPPGYIEYGPPLQCVTPEYNQYCNTHLCPICLAADTQIATPLGPVAVKDLQVGAPVWTTNKTGQRIQGIITKTSKVPVPPTHQMVKLTLDDGRVLFVSPGHPTTDGRTMNDLVVGQRYDGALIKEVAKVPYDKDATYDLLPSGDTGFYWANGILVGSTLK